MMKNVLFAIAVMSVALWSGCATGGGGHTGAQIVVTATAASNFVAVTLTDQFTAHVDGTSDQTVTWSLAQNGGGACTGTPNPCGMIDATGLYTAPATPIQVVVTATSVANPTKSDSVGLNVAAITVLTTPKLNDNSLNVVKGVSQLFTATGGPDDSRVQTFTWSLVCDAGAGLCGTLTPDPQKSYSATYTATNSIPSPAVAHITATSTIDTTASDTVDVTIVKNRLSPNSTYAFHLSGFNASGPIAVAGNILTDANGAISSGFQDELTITTQATRVIDSGSVTLDSNLHGLMTLHTTSAGSRSYKVVFNTAGDGQMIEFDGTGSQGSGQIAVAKAKFSNTSLPLGSTFAFGMTGVDQVLKRLGVAGLLQPDGAGAITFGLLDINDFATATSSSNVTGTYDVAANGRGTMSLTDNTSGKTYHYAFYLVSGQPNKATNPLTMFVISTDDPQVNPAVSGTIVTQDTGQVYDNSALGDFSISNLTGLDSSGTKTLVSLTDARGDKNGNFIGTYAANNAGTIVAADPNKPFNYTYAFTSGAHGRYTIDMLGDPNASPVVPPVHFVLYLTTANQGFLLDQSSQAVYTGTMDQAIASNPRAAELAGSMEAVTANSAASTVPQTASNFQFILLPPTPPFTGARDQTDGGQTAGQALAGTFVVNSDSSGSLVLTQPGAENYVLYVLDNPKTSNSLIQHFVMINVDKTVTGPAVIFGER